MNRAYMHTRMHSSIMRACMCACLDTSPMNLLTHTYVQHASAHMHACVHAYTHAHAHTRTQIHTHARTNTHTHTHAHAPKAQRKNSTGCYSKDQNKNDTYEVGSGGGMSSQHPTQRLWFTQAFISISRSPLASHMQIHYKHTNGP
jgi:hypothetical protein